MFKNNSTVIHFSGGAYKKSAAKNEKRAENDFSLSTKFDLKPLLPPLPLRLLPELCICLQIRMSRATSAYNIIERRLMCASADMRLVAKTVIKHMPRVKNV